MVQAVQTVTAGLWKWGYQQCGSETARQLPVLLLHGLPSYSYGWREVLPVLAEQTRRRVVALDWLGFGASDKPDRSAFDYTPEAYLAQLPLVLEALGIERCALVAQGFLGSVGVQFALRAPKRIEKLVVINAPLTRGAKLPWNLQQLGLPLMGEMLTQNPLSVDQTLEGGGYTVIPNGDLGMYRRPYSLSGDAGRALMLAIRNLRLAEATAEIEAGLASWKRGQAAPFAAALVWGMRDRYLKATLARDFADTYPQIKFFALADAGHYPQEEDLEGLNDALVRCLL